MENSNNSRWWETYLVRYITGSVVGAVIVYIVLKKAGIDLIPCFDEIKNSNLIVLSALGFAYCYLASAPITLLHATRSLVGKPGGFGMSNSLFMLLLALISLLFAILAWFTYSELWMLNSFIGMLIFIVYYLAFDLFNKVDHKEQWHSWYSDLAISRENGSREFVESYRHLREHGNAFFIVLMEIALAVPLFMIVELQWEMQAKIAFMLFMIILWLIPGGVCWFLGNSLERHFMKTKSLQIDQKESQTLKYRRPNVWNRSHRR